MNNKPKNLTGIDAKSYERIGNRIILPQTPETMQRIKDDMWGNLQTELDKEGHTGKLSEKDGMIHFEPFEYKGFTVEIYGRKEYISPLDPFGQLRYIGLAKGKVLIRKKETEMTLDIENMLPHGFDTAREASQFLVQLIELYRNPKIKGVN